MDLKKLTIVNVVLIIAVVILFILHFACGNSGCVNPATAETSENGSDTSVVMTGGDGKVLRIAWANSDTVSKYYLAAQSLEKGLVEEQMAAESQLKALEDKYLKKEKAFADVAKILGPTEYQMKMEELQALQNEYLQTQQALQMQLSQKEQERYFGFLELTHKYMQEIGKEMGYDYIISYRLEGQVIYADKAHDITNEIIEKLNAAYTSAGE